MRSLLSLLSVIALTTFASAETIDVPADYPTIQGAVDAANNGDEILVGPGTYTSSDDQVVDLLGKSLAIRATGTPEETILDGQNERQVMRCVGIEVPGTVIQGFTIINGYSTENGGGIYCFESSPTITSCILQNNSATNGGAIYFRNSDASLTDTQFIANTAEERGGAITMYRTDAAFEDCVFSDNNGFAGGALFAEDDCDIEMDRCDLIGNSAGSYETFFDYGYGGTFLGIVDVDFILNECDIQNSQGVYGTALFLQVESSCTFINTNASGSNFGEIDPTTNPFYIGLNGYTAWESSSLIFAGTCTANDVSVLAGGASVFMSDARVEITGTLKYYNSPTLKVWSIFDVDQAGQDPLVTIDGDLVIDGGLGITNQSSSLLSANEGDVFELIQVNGDITEFTPNGFLSFVSPVMDPALTLEFSQDFDSGLFSAQVVPDTSPFIQDLADTQQDARVVDMAMIDVDGQPGEELINLSSQGLTAWDIYLDPSNPQLIEELSEPASSFNEPIDMDSADLNQDGLGDFLIANEGDSTVTRVMAVSDGNSVSLESTSIEIPNLIPGTSVRNRSVAIINWDGNDNYDAVVGSYNVNSSDFVVGSNYQILLDVGSDDTLQFGPSFDIPAFTNTFGQGEANTYYQKPLSLTRIRGLGFIGSTMYGLIHKVEPSNPDLQLISNMNGLDGWHLETGDLDLDGCEDLICSSVDAECLFIFYADDSEEFGYAGAVALPIGDPVIGSYITDINSDCLPDIVISVGNDVEDPLRLIRNDAISNLGMARNDYESGWSQFSITGDRTWRSHHSRPPGGGPGGNETQLPQLGSSSAPGGYQTPPWPDDDEPPSDPLPKKKPIAGAASFGFGGLRGDEEDLQMISFNAVETPCELCLTDINGANGVPDGLTNIYDLLTVIDNWGQTGYTGDINCDGLIDIGDLLLILGDWGSSCGS